MISKVLTKVTGIALIGVAGYFAVNSVKMFKKIRHISGNDKSVVKRSILVSNLPCGKRVSEIQYDDVCEKDGKVVKILNRIEPLVMDNPIANGVDVTNLMPRLRKCAKIRIEDEGIVEGLVTTKTSYELDLKESDEILVIGEFNGLRFDTDKDLLFCRKKDLDMIEEGYHMRLCINWLVCISMIGYGAVILISGDKLLDIMMGWE